MKSIRTQSILQLLYGSLVFQFVRDRRLVLQKIIDSLSPAMIQPVNECHLPFDLLPQQSRFPKWNNQCSKTSCGKKTCILKFKVEPLVTLCGMLEIREGAHFDTMQFCLTKPVLFFTHMARTQLRHLQKNKMEMLGSNCMF